jgi:hypothetical protein
MIVGQGFTHDVTVDVQGLLPAGWLAFTGRESNPLDHYERFQFVLTIILLSCSPNATKLISAIGKPWRAGFARQSAAHRRAIACTSERESVTQRARD